MLGPQGLWEHLHSEALLLPQLSPMDNCDLCRSEQVEPAYHKNLAQSHTAATGKLSWPVTQTNP